MSLIPKIKVPNLSKSAEQELNNINITNPTASNATAALFILSQLAGVSIVFLVELGILRPPHSWQWIPLGVLIFGVLTVPLARLKGTREAIYAVLLVFDFTGYIYVFTPDLVRNAMLVFIGLFIAFAIVEFPRRFNLG